MDNGESGELRSTVTGIGYITEVLQRGYTLPAGLAFGQEQTTHYFTAPGIYSVTASGTFWRPAKSGPGLEWDGKLSSKPLIVYVEPATK
jgi:hypothetical protein